MFKKYEIIVFNACASVCVCNSFCEGMYASLVNNIKQIHKHLHRKTPTQNYTHARQTTKSGTDKLTIWKSICLWKTKMRTKLLLMSVVCFIPKPYQWYMEITKKVWFSSKRKIYVEYCEHSKYHTNNRVPLTYVWSLWYTSICTLNMSFAVIHLTTFNLLD